MRNIRQKLEIGHVPDMPDVPDMSDMPDVPDLPDMSIFKNSDGG